MKTLSALVVVQLVLLVATLLRVFALEETLAETNQRPVEHVPQTAVRATRTTDNHFAGAAISEQLLRQVIRDELATQLQSSDAPVANVAVDSMSDLVFDADYDIQRQMVDQTLDYFVEVGRISNPEMIELQFQIARLNANDRSAMLGKLGRLIAAGQVDGKF